MVDGFVVVATFPNVAEAEAARLALEAAGIQAFLRDDELVSMVWLLGNAVGYVKLLVAAPDADRAQLVLRTAYTDWPQPLAASGSDSGLGGPMSDVGEDEPDRTAAGDAEARRAWRASIFGLFFCPPLLIIYAVYLLLRFAASPQPLSDRGRRHLAGAVTVNLLLIALIATFAFAVYRSSI
jgi:hypothetical protein